MPTLVITNDFPPRLGGIENMVRAACGALDGDVVVLTRRESGSLQTAAFDAKLGYRVVRIRGPLLPTRRVLRAAEALLAETGAKTVLIGAAAPLGLLAARLRVSGSERIVALTHGHEVTWSRFRPTRQLLERIGGGVDTLTAISDYTAAAVAVALPGPSKVLRLSPPVDTAIFAPGEPPDGPVCVCAARFVAQKGIKNLLRAWPDVRRRVPGARLLIAGAGPLSPEIAKAAGRVVGVEFIGRVSHRDMPEFLRRGRVFALPVRSLFGGRYAEGLGTVFLEAAACGLPVVVGRSGGAPETVRPGATGTVVDPERPYGIATAIAELLLDPDRARAWGLAGRDFVAAEFGFPRFRSTLRRALGLAA